ncbi:MAG TPA: STM3941 family protein [Actinomycetota bacterium]|nr:STM3941 family protein [Actinomycetota bacterium]
MEPFEVRRSRWKLILLGSFSGLLAALGVIVALDGGSPWMVLGSLGFGVLSVFTFREASRARPALVIDDAGIEDTRVGLRLGWDEVEEVRLRRSWTNLAPQTWLLLRVRDLTAVVERIPHRVGRKLGRLDARLGVRTIFFVLNLLAERPARIMDEIRRRAPGAVTG